LSAISTRENPLSNTLISSRQRPYTSRESQVLLASALSVISLYKFSTLVLRFEAVSEFLFYLLPIAAAYTSLFASVGKESMRLRCRNRLGSP